MFNACFLMSYLPESVLSEIPEKASESFLFEVFLPKVFRPKVFDFDVAPIPYRGSLPCF